MRYLPYTSSVLVAKPKEPVKTSPLTEKSKFPLASGNPSPMLQVGRRYLITFLLRVSVVVLPRLSVADILKSPDSTPLMVPSPFNTFPPHDTDLELMVANLTPTAPISTSAFEQNLTIVFGSPVSSTVVGLTSTTTGDRVGAGFLMVRVRVR